MNWIRYCTISKQFSDSNFELLNSSHPSPTQELMIASKLNRVLTKSLFGPENNFLTLSLYSLQDKVSINDDQSIYIPSIVNCKLLQVSNLPIKYLAH